MARTIDFAPASSYFRIFQNGDFCWMRFIIFVLMWSPSVQGLLRHSFRTAPSRLRSRVIFSAAYSTASEESSISFSETVLLPTTKFSQRANSIAREPEIQKFWDQHQIYESLKSESKEKFTLHDGPPYANGDLHIGHALNKILKDIVNRYQILQGKSVEVVPGWDCHGLPIELKVIQSLSAKQRKGLTQLDIRNKAGKFAQETVDTQRASFQRYGIWADWDTPYLTLHHEYEAAQIDVFGKMFFNGHIYRGFKPVHWSPSSRTALAEAELEYPENHSSKSIFLTFDVVKASPALENFNDNLKLTCWTTTPWTIPSNLAVAFNPSLKYCVVLSKKGLLVVAHGLVDSLTNQLEMGPLTVLASFLGSDLAGTQYRHPLNQQIFSMVAGGEYITADAGTGLVHTAPGHGQEDYNTGLKYGLPIFSPVDDAGRFTAEAGAEFEGLNVLKEGNDAVIAALDRSEHLLQQNSYRHKYPYDWRTKKPTIFRSTDQWFASVADFREEALKAIEEVRWTPQVGQKRIANMVQGRNDWCISRQRAWGVPIPVFYHIETGEVLLTTDTLDHIKSLFAANGSNIWWEKEVKDLLPESFADVADDYRKGNDTMDVWFDSGSSWAGVLKQRGMGFPADLYLEGSDQHRGWFQSSLLTAISAEGIAPYKHVLTHGFVLDEKGVKMSKSLGNVVSPLEIIQGGKNKKENPAYGADVLRLWVASVDYSSDVCIGKNVIKQVFESYRRLRNTARFLLGNLNAFNPDVDSVPYDDLPSIDKYILGEYSRLYKDVDTAYHNFQFFKASQLLLKFCSNELSSFYLDTAKDRLYISEESCHRRRSAQTVLAVLVQGLAKMVAPILPHLAEDMWMNLPFSPNTKSVFQGGWTPSNFEPHEEEEWKDLLKIRRDVNKCIEIARRDKLVGSNNDCLIKLYPPNGRTGELLQKFSGDEDLRWPPDASNAVDELKYVFMVSQVEVLSNAVEVDQCDVVVASKDTESGCVVGMKQAAGAKCMRCWMYCRTVGSHSPHLCPRCSSSVHTHSLASPRS